MVFRTCLKAQWNNVGIDHVRSLRKSPKKETAVLNDNYKTYYALTEQEKSKKFKDTENSPNQAAFVHNPNGLLLFYSSATMQA